MIYETMGRAREYFELAANLYTGCGHRCGYCYGADVTHTRPDEFFERPKAKNLAIERLRADASRLANKCERRHILLSFVTDPYQPLDVELKVTRRAIQVLHDFGLHVAILTKGGQRAVRDFDLLTKYDWFGVSLTTFTRATWWEWERFTGTQSIERVKTLEMAKEKGVPTWVSCEPVLDTNETLKVIEYAAPYVDVFKVGTLNYRKEAARIHWKKFAEDVVALLEGLGKSYYIKKDLARFLGEPDGITKGGVPT